jgi:lipoprotein-releasing system permease protein
MLSVKIAWRFLRSSPAQTILIVAGIAVGISAQIFVGSLITSLQASLVNQTIGSSPQVTIAAEKDGDPVRYTTRVADIITTDPRVKPGSIAKTRTTTALYTNDTDSAPLNLIGGELRELNGIYNISDQITRGRARLGTNDVLIGKDFAEKFLISPGSSIRLRLSSGATASFNVAGIFDLGSAAFNERTAFVSGEVPRALLGWSADEYGTIQAQFIDPFESQAAAADWRRKLPLLSIKEWQEQNADLLVALQSQSSSSYMIQGFVLVAVALGIASTLAISAVQKTRQIGILKAMGMKDGPAGRIFLYAALILGGLGSLSGLALGAGFIWLFSFVPTTFAVTLQPSFALLSASIGVLVALLSSLIPIRATSRLDPIEVIQGG